MQKNKLIWIGVAVVVVILLVLVQQGIIKLPRAGASGYQAVFMANNQVYFGRLSSVGSAYPVLNDVFYFRVTQELQPSDPDTLAQQLQLVKLGEELHGPVDEMRINRSQILFIEDLKKDSQVVKAITDYKAAQQATN